MTSNNIIDSPFDTLAKGIVRRIDSKHISNFKEKYYPDQKLSYLGLPGPQLLDVLAWREFIGTWTAVQEVDTVELAADADELELNVLLNNLERDFYFLKGNIDDYIVSSKESGSVSKTGLRWPFNIINLDYIGGLVYIKKDITSRHIEAIKALIDRQAKEEFILFLTLNLRDKDAGEMTNMVQSVQEELLDANCTCVSEKFKQHALFKNAGLQKIYVPIILESHAKGHNIEFHAPILYQGSKQMMHFVMEFTPFTKLAGGRASSIKMRLDAINLPLIIIDSEGNIKQENLGPPITT